MKNKTMSKTEELEDNPNILISLWSGNSHAAFERHLLNILI